jgi:hypothetical protein
MSESPSWASVAESLAGAEVSDHTDIWGGHAASDIRNAPLQQALENSLTDSDANVIGDHRSNEWFEGVEESFEDEQAPEEVEAEPEQRDYSAEREAFRAQQEKDQILDEAEASLREQEQPVELTPAQISEGISQLGQAVEQLGLNDAPAAQQLAYDLTAPFGGAEGVNPALLGDVMSKTVLSALQVHEAQADNPQLGPIHPAAAQAFTSDFLRAFGVDARMANVDSQHFAGTVLVGTLNLLDAVKQYGPNAAVEKLNSPAGAEWLMTNINKAFGINAPVDRATALHIADAGARYVLSLLGKLPRQAEQGPTRQTRRTARNSQSDDMGPDFWQSAAQVYREQKGRL